MRQSHLIFAVVRQKCWQKSDGCIEVRGNNMNYDSSCCYHEKVLPKIPTWRVTFVLPYRPNGTLFYDIVETTKERAVFEATKKMHADVSNPGNSSFSSVIPL